MGSINPGAGDEARPYTLSLRLREEPDLLFINVHVPFDGEIPGTDAHVAHTDIPALLDAAGPELSQPVVIYCRTRNMASIAGQALVDQGYCAVRYLEGGMSAWTAAGFSLLPQGVFRPFPPGSGSPWPFPGPLPM
jgi:rhodanese-related sulfurtransferase